MSSIKDLKENILLRENLLKVQKEDYEKTKFLGYEVGTFELYNNYIESLSIAFKKLVSDKNLKISFNDLAINKKWLDIIGQMQDILTAAYPMINDETSDPLLMGYLYVKFYQSGFGHAISFFRKLAIIINNVYKFNSKKINFLSDKNCIDILIKYDLTYKFILSNFDNEIRNCIAHEDYIINKDNTIKFMTSEGKIIKKTFVEIGLMDSYFSFLNNALIFVVTNYELKLLKRHLNDKVSKNK
ncbi:MAG: hypothetical protein WC376_02685 [Candidatus Nanoarchaeia archaeon]|jgi:hypothetical protein